MITLPDGRQFDECDLQAAIQASGRNYIIQGQQNNRYADHSKPQSLDYWIRTRFGNSDTKLAENIVMDQLVATGLFIEDNHLPCPHTGERCKGLRIVVDGVYARP